MAGWMEDIWAEVQELPGGALEVWSEAFREALVRTRGDVRRAAAMAWGAFKKPGTSWSQTGGWDESDRRAVPRTVEAGEAAPLEVERLVAEVREILGLPEGASGAEIKAAIEELRSGRCRVGGEAVKEGTAGSAENPERIAQVIAEAVANGWLKPEQRGWAQVQAARDWRGFIRFLDLVAQASFLGRERSHWELPFFRSVFG